MPDRLYSMFPEHRVAAEIADLVLQSRSARGNKRCHGRACPGHAHLMKPEEVERPTLGAADFLDERQGAFAECQ